MKNSNRLAAERHAIFEFPRESCGILFMSNKDGQEHYHPCRNIAPTPNQHFAIAPEDYEKARAGGEIVGFVHSHPGYPPIPSEGDLTSCELTETAWHIVRVDLNEVTDRIEATGWHSWKPNGYRAPLVGRSFHYGVQDCFALARDWYLEELGVVLPDVLHGPDEWWQDKNSTFSPYEDSSNHEKVGLIRLDGPVNLQVGDLVVMQIRSRTGKPNHVGIITDSQRCIMLHHLHGALSERTIYGGYWREATRFVLRRKA